MNIQRHTPSIICPPMHFVCVCVWWSVLTCLGVYSLISRREGKVLRRCDVKYNVSTSLSLQQHLDALSLYCEINITAVPEELRE